MKKIVLLLLTSINTFGQPDKPKTHPACNTPNPPWWCGTVPTNPLPLDDYLPILFIGGAVIGGYFYNKKQLKTNNYE